MSVPGNSLVYARMPLTPSRITARPGRGNGSRLEEHEEDSYPEKRLWVSIILHTVQEYELHLQTARKLWDSSRQPVNKQLLIMLNAIRHEVYHDWFRHICDLADLDQSHVIRRLRALETQYRLSEIVFSTADGLTRYQTRKARAACRK